MSIAAANLRAYIERIERLEEQRKEIADDIAAVYKELSGEGYDKEAAKTVLRIRRKEDGLATWDTRSLLVDTYLVALGMVSDADTRRARAHTRENIEEFDAETGELTSSQAGHVKARHGATKPAESLGDTISAPSFEESREGDASPPPVASLPVDPPPTAAETAATIPFVLRRHCLHPENCAGYGSTHCRQCLRAAQEAA